MSILQDAKEFEKLLHLQISQLRTMEKSELNRLACIVGNNPEGAFAIEDSCTEIFEKSTSLQKKLDVLANRINLDKLPAEEKSKLFSLEYKLKALIKRNLELNIRCQDTLKSVAGEVSEKIRKVKYGKKAINSYKSPHLNIPKSISGRI